MTLPALVSADRSGDPIAPVALAAPVPTFTGEQMRQAFSAYQALQHALDASMPDQILDLDGRKFRKKGYWRAIAVAFNLTVEPVDERRAVDGTFEDGQENFGWVITYRARTASGRTAVGDGACFAIEKAARGTPATRWARRPLQASEHNIRSHACTRAFNRAVANLVGFGEVSAEEIDRDDDTRPISAGQVKRLFAVAKQHAWPTDALREYLRTQHGVRASDQIRRSDYDAIVTALEVGPPAPVPIPVADADSPF